MASLVNAASCSCCRRYAAAAAGPLAAVGIPTVQPRRARIGALSREVADTLVARSPRLAAAGRQIELRGQAALVDVELREVALAPMAVLRALAHRPGHVVSRKELTAALLAHAAFAGSPHAFHAIGGFGMTSRCDSVMLRFYT